ncbi:MAG: hypothetical protein LBU94_05645 [Clostridiales bacterium]|jgi:hypothetical protein|nr:hypothetical protein [Clostridiales bacterium]
MMVRYDEIKPVKGNNFKHVSTIFSGVKEEALFEHIETGLRVKCNTNLIFCKGNRTKG